VAAQRKKMQMKRRRKKRARAQEEEEKKKKKKKEEEEEEEEEETRRKRFSNLNQVPLTQRVMRHVFATSLLAPTPALFVFRFLRGGVQVGARDVPPAARPVYACEARRSDQEAGLREEEPEEVLFER
jgi:hypothetical protein